MVDLRFKSNLIFLLFPLILILILELPFLFFDLSNFPVIISFELISADFAHLRLFFLLFLQGISEIIKRYAALQGIIQIDPKYERPLQ